METKQTPYPWYTPNQITARLEPFALYAAAREQFNRLYQPESQLWTGDSGDLTSLLQDLERNEESYGWLCSDPIIRNIAHMLIGDPVGLTRLALINSEYMNGFRHKKDPTQARIHTMTACLLMGHWDDHLITKKWLRWKTLALWAGAKIRATASMDSPSRYRPTRSELNVAYCELPPILKYRVGKKWPWERIFKSLGLDSMRQANQKKQTTIPTAFTWNMEAEPPETYQQLTDFLDAYCALDGE
jgi:hypothetical protein